MTTEEIDEIVQRVTSVLTHHTQLINQLTSVAIQQRNYIDELNTLFLSQDKLISDLQARVTQLESQLNPPPTDDAGSPG